MRPDVTPDARGATPGARGATPEARGATPGARGATPGARGATPGARGVTPGARGATPDARGATPGARPSLSIVIPSYRGVDRLPGLLDDLELVMSRRFPEWEPGAIEVIIVDDGSPSAEQRALRDLVAGRNESVHRNNLALRRESVRRAFFYQTVCLPENRGQQYATIAGVSLTTGDLVATIDDDGGHPPDHLASMVQAMIADEAIDLLCGAPFASDEADGRGTLRRIGTSLNNLLFRFFAGKPTDVPVTSFRVIRRRLVDRAIALPVRYAYLSAMLFAFRPTAAAYRYEPVELHGDTRYSIPRLMRIFWSLCLYWGPLRFVGSLLRPAVPLDLPRGCE